MRERPVVAARMVESGEAMGGVGEPFLRSATPAVANAVSALVGKRVRTPPTADAPEV